MSARRLAPLLRMLAAAAALIALASCTQADEDPVLPNEPTDAATTAPADGAPNTGGGTPSADDTGVADDVDYEDDAGADMVAHEYPDDPEPAAESASTLCNLSSQYVQSLRTTTDEGVPIVDDDLRLSVLAMSDNLLLWESMRSHFPEYDDAIDDAQQVRDLWDEALLNVENGDEAAAEQAMLAAEDVLEELPEGAASDAIDCS